MVFLRQIFFHAPLRLFFSLACLFTVLWLSVHLATAWWPEPHKAIGRNALGILPGGLKEVLEANPENLSALLYGVVEPDYNRVEDHRVYLKVIRGKEPGPGGVHTSLEKYAQKGEEMIRAGEPMDKIAFVLGQAAHFIQDASLPLHTIYGDTKAQHRAYEEAAYVWNWPGERQGYKGFYLMKNYKCFAYEAAKRSHLYYRKTLQNPPSREVIEKTWDDAVNDTANLWLSIFYRALGPAKTLELYGIPVPKGEVGKGSVCG